MIWEQNIKILVMLTGLSERGMVRLDFIRQKKTFLISSINKKRYKLRTKLL